MGVSWMHDFLFEYSIFLKMLQNRLDYFTSTVGENINRDGKKIRIKGKLLGKGIKVNIDSLRII